eukprot:3020960-Pyramimonas_sp.AAC.1
MFRWVSRGNTRRPMRRRENVSMHAVIYPFPFRIRGPIMFILWFRVHAASWTRGPKLAKAGPSWPRQAQACPGWPTLPQAGPGSHRLAQAAPGCPQAGPDGPKLAQVAKWPRLRQAGPG